MTIQPSKRFMEAADHLATVSFEFGERATAERAMDRSTAYAALLAAYTADLTEAIATRDARICELEARLCEREEHIRQIDRFAQR